MNHHITVGLDGSRESIAAAHWAADEAELRNVELRLIHAEGGRRAAFPPPPRHDANGPKRCSGNRPTPSATTIPNSPSPHSRSTVHPQPRSPPPHPQQTCSSWDLGRSAPWQGSFSARSGWLSCIPPHSLRARTQWRRRNTEPRRRAPRWPGRRRRHRQAVRRVASVCVRRGVAPGLPTARLARLPIATAIRVWSRLRPRRLRGDQGGDDRRATRYGQTLARRVPHRRRDCRYAGGTRSTHAGGRRRQGRPDRRRPADPPRIAGPAHRIDHPRRDSPCHRTDRRRRARLRRGQWYSAGRRSAGPLPEVEHALAGLLKGRTGQIGPARCHDGIA